LLALGQD
jgi:hypothetical protein